MVLYHLHLRKRIHLLKEKYPHPKAFVRFIDNLMIIIAIAAPLATVPQIYKVWIEQNAQGVSLLSWGTYSLICFPMLAYGFIHKEKPLILLYSLNLIVNLAVFFGVIIY